MLTINLKAARALDLNVPCVSPASGPSRTFGNPALMTVRRERHSPMCAMNLHRFIGS